MNVKIIAILIMSAVACIAEVAITVYNDGFGLVKEERTIDVEKGISSFDYSPVPSGIFPQTVHLKGSGIAVLEQNYEYDLVSTDRLLEKNIDNEIRITTEKGDVFEGELLAADGSSILLKIKSELTTIRVEQILEVTFPRVPDRFYTRPTLAWLLYCEKGGKQNTELSYMTGGIGWEAAYVSTVNRDDTRLTLDGWVTISNRSGMTYEDATLKLVAGDVHRAEQKHAIPARAKGGYMEADASVLGFEEESFFEYHLYSLPRSTTVADRQDKQLSLFEPAETPAEKKFIFESSRGNKVRVEMVFKNSKERGLGMPLPEGIIRVYKEDKSGALQFVGEDRIEHTPKDEEVRIYLGNAFDITVERNQTDYRRISNRVSEEDYEIKIRNHKEEDVVVKVVEHFWGDWYIKAHSEKGNQKDARTYEWEIAIPKDGETILTYTVKRK